MEVGCEAGDMAEVEHVECAALRGEGQREREGEREREFVGGATVYRVTQGEGKTQTSGLTSSRFIRCEARFGSCLKPMRSSQGP